MMPPSRRSNPFATCWTRPGALSFQFPEGRSARQMISQLAAHNWLGQIVGPHGSGKSSLVATLVPEIVAAGRQVKLLSARAGELYDCAAPPSDSALRHQEHGPASLPLSRSRVLQVAPGLPVVIVEGFEQLGWWQRRQWRTVCRRRGVGLLVTSHQSCGLPMLIRLVPDCRLIEQLVADLCTQVSTGITMADVAASYARHGANVREILFELYDRHERWSQYCRTRSQADT